MARALVEIVGDSASAVRALEQTSAAVDTTTASFEELSVAATKSAEAMVAASAQRAARFQAEAAAAQQLSTTYAVGSREQEAAAALAARRTTQANRLLGEQAAAHRNFLATSGQIGRGLTTYVTAPTAFIGYEAVKRAMDFQQQLLLIRTQAGASQQELEQMNASVLHLVSSGQSYGQSAQEMAQGLYYVESEGIRGARALATLQAAAAGAAKGQTDMVDTTNALTSAMKIWNVPAAEAAKTMATIDAITATGKMHLEDLNAAFNTRYFSTAAGLGVPLEQAGALIDVFTKLGVPAESAATNLTTTLIRMVNPAKGATGALKELGLTEGQLGKDLQSGGLTKALADLSSGYEKLVQAKGPAAGEAAVFAAFGGSHGGGAALQALKGYQSYLESIGQIQRLNNPATFWSQVSQTMNTPAMKVKQDVAEIGADFIQLGTALAPIAAELAHGVTEISGAFGALPGPVKRDLGVIIGILAVGGPLGLTIKGVGTLVGGMSTAFRTMAGSAAASAATTEASIAGIGKSAVVAEGEVATLRGTLLGLAGKTFATALILNIIPKSNLGQDQLDKLGLGFLGHIPLLGGAETQIAAAGYKTNQALTGALGLPTDADKAAGARRAHALTHPGPLILPYDFWKRQHPDGTRAEYDQYVNVMRGGGGGGSHAGASAARHARATSTGGGGGSHFTADIPTHLQLQLVRAQLAGNLQAERQALQDEQAFLQHEAAIAKNDKQRLAALQAEETVTGELASVNSQIAEEAKKHRDAQKKLHDTYSLPARLQVEMAKADAEAALHPGLGGPTDQQIRLAKRAKADALRAIHSHTLTMQGLIDAWGQVQQDNSVLAQLTNQANLYHSVSTAALTRGLGLTHQADLTLRERIAQAQAHRGYAPNRGYNTGHHHVHVDVHLKGDANKFVSQVNQKNRGRYQRAGGRR